VPSTLPVILCAAAAAAFWTLIGGAVGRRLGLSRALIWPLAPGLGWAVHSALALPIFLLVGFSARNVFVLAILSVLAGLLLQRSARGLGDQDDSSARVPVWAFVGAALIALAPAAAVIPKFTAEGVVLDPAIYDHAKVAIIDEIALLGVPPGNPFFGEVGESARLAYYYLWHFAAAELSVLARIGGWGADIALTWFTAFASLAAMLGLATWFTGRRSVAGWVLVLSLAASLRPVLGALLGVERVSKLVWDATGFAGWLFQAAWVPQHLASATCVVVAILLMARMRERPGVLTPVILALVVAAGFGSSTWVGGLVFALAALAATVALAAGAEGRERAAFLLRLGAAAVLASALATPFLYDQLMATATRGGTPVGLQPYPVLATAVPDAVRRWLDLPAYWLVLLVIEFPAIYPAGVVALVRSLASDGLKGERRLAAIAFAALMAASLATAWLLASRIGDNNDLAWRAVLPGVMALTVFAAVGLSRWVAARAVLPAAAAIAALLLALPDGARLVREYTDAPIANADEAFEDAPNLWDAVRGETAPRERVGNNPLLMQDTTAWPINISWALLANRRSCYAGLEYAKVFFPLSPERRAEVDAQFVRVFAGEGSPSDVRDLAVRYRCRVVVITPDDGAWQHDPFADSPYYRLVQEEEDGWRIYRADGVGMPPP
jgi:hypothetical protein